jgi:hypothetical protein
VIGWMSREATLSFHITRKVEYSTSEKRLDFIIGFVGWFVLNFLLFVLTTALSTFFSLLYFSIYSSFQAAGSVVGTVYGILNVCLGFGLPAIVNIGGLIYFAVARRWIALGALSAFGLSVLCVLLAGIIIAVLCLNIPQR